MTYIDCHFHFAEKYFYKRADELVKNWLKLDISKIVTVARNLKDSQRNIELVKKYPNLILACIGRHPWGAHKFSEEELFIYKGLAQNQEVSIIGEVGLDHYFIKDKNRWKNQITVLEQFIQIANHNKKSLMLHMTGAEEEMYQILTSSKLEVNFCCHWYSGSTKILKKLSDLGSYFTVNPAFLRSKKHKKVLELVDKSYLLTESDGPVKFKGEPGTPALIPMLCEEIAKEIKMPIEELNTILQTNFLKYIKNQ